MNANVPSSPSSNNLKNVLVAGHYGGKPVYCRPELIDDIERLKSAANQGNHWARLALKELAALTTGHSGKKNIYIHESEPSKIGLMKLTVFLPGLVATVIPQSKGSYVIESLELDYHYLNAAENGIPGLYQANFKEGAWEPKRLQNGRIKNEEGRAIAISDAQYDEPRTAAQSASKGLTLEAGMPDESDLRAKGFDLHYTPGKKKLGGYRRYDALRTNDDFRSAQMLADTMLNAKNVEGAYWIAERGGSAVLTQAMQILANKNETLKGHKVFLVRPSTSPSQAVKLAHQLKLTVNRTFAQTGVFDIVGATDHLLASNARVKAAKDLYDKGDRAKTYKNLVLKTAAASGAAATIGGAFPAVAAIAGTGFLGTVGLVATVLGSSSTVLGEVYAKLPHGKNKAIKKA